MPRCLGTLGHNVNKGKEGGNVCLGVFCRS